MWLHIVKVTTALSKKGAKLILTRGKVGKFLQNIGGGAGRKM